MCPNPFCSNKRNNHNQLCNWYWKNSQNDSSLNFFYLLVTLIKTYLFSFSSSISIENTRIYIMCNNTRIIRAYIVHEKNRTSGIWSNGRGGINRVVKLNHGELDAERIEDDTRACRSRFTRIWAITPHFHGALPFWASFAIILNRISRIHGHVAERERKYHSRRIGFSWSHRPGRLISLFIPATRHSSR